MLKILKKFWKICLRGWLNGIACFFLQMDQKLHRYDQILELVAPLKSKADALLR